MNVEVYGFIFWIVSFASMALWVLWAFCPDEIIRDVLSVSFYPSKWWAVALPTYGVIVFFMINAAYMGLNLTKTQPLNSRHLVSDESTVVVPFLQGDDHDIPSAHDIPLRMVNKLMYDT